MSELIFVGDVGGTNIRFGLVSSGTDQLTIEGFPKTPNDAYQEDILSSFVTRGELSHFLDQCPVKILTEPSALLIAETSTPTGNPAPGLFPYRQACAR